MNSLHIKPRKDEDIWTLQYMESKNEFKLDLIGIDNTAFVRYFFAVNSYLFPDTIMLI